jgi:LEA14-like dessication related protein
MVDFKVLPQEGITPRFEIGFRIINPNLDPLNFEGIFYTVDIEGHRVLAGVSDNLPTVAPYGEANITLEATVDLIKGIQFISALINKPRDTFKYSFNAKLDPGGITPKIIIKEEGEFNLRNEM